MAACRSCCCCRWRSSAFGSSRITGRRANCVRQRAASTACDAIQQHFTAGEIGPITVLLTRRPTGTVRKGRRVLTHTSRGLGYLDNVAEVRSLTQPLGSAAAGDPAHCRAARDRNHGRVVQHRSARTWTEVREQADRSAREFYLADAARKRPTAAVRHAPRRGAAHRSVRPQQSIDTLDLIQTVAAQGTAARGGAAGQRRRGVLRRHGQRPRPGRRHRERPLAHQRAGAGRHLPDPAGAGAPAVAGGVSAGDGAVQLSTPRWGRRRWLARCGPAGRWARSIGACRSSCSRSWWRSARITTSC